MKVPLVTREVFVTERIGYRDTQNKRRMLPAN